MKLYVVLALVALATARPDGEKYNSKYNNFDVDSLTSNDRLLKAYTLCFIGTGKCTAEGADFKKWIPEALQTCCGKCTEKQKPLVAKTFQAIKTKLPKEYAELSKIYDLENKYADDIKNFLNKYSS